MRTGAIAFGLVVFIGITTPASSQPAGAGVLAGSTTADNQPVAGVMVAVSNELLARRAVTDPAGRYRIAGLPPGTYTVTATLVGFQPAAVDVVIKDDSDEMTLDFQLRPGALCDVDFIVPGSTEALLDVDLIAVVRVSTPRGSGAWVETRPGSFRLQHDVVLTEILASRVLTAAHVPFLQSSGIQDGRGGVVACNGEEPYRDGQQFVAFLVWIPELGAVEAAWGPSAMIPIQRGRIRWPGLQIAGIRDGMPLREFVAVLRGRIARTR
jgi:hypothetical protein